MAKHIAYISYGRVRPGVYVDITLGYKFSYPRNKWHWRKSGLYCRYIPAMYPMAPRQIARQLNINGASQPRVRRMVNVPNWRR